MRYMLVVVWSDCLSKSESTDFLPNALTAAAVYLEDPDCQGIDIIDRQTDTLILQWAR